MSILVEKFDIDEINYENSFMLFIYLAIHLFLRRSYFVTRMHYALSTIVESIMIFTLAILCTLAGS